MAKFVIQPHGRLQEWIAHEKGYFRDEGLDYEFVAARRPTARRVVDASGKVSDLMAGAFESRTRTPAATRASNPISPAPATGR